jgi:hypothetical protein
MTETDGRQWLRRKLGRFNLQLQAIESGGTGIGIPDLYLRHSEGAMWIELKIGHYVGTGIRVLFRPGQLPWLQTNVSLGGNVALLMFVPHEEGNDFSWWVLKNSDIRASYTLEELATLGKGYLSGKLDGLYVLKALAE